MAQEQIEVEFMRRVTTMQLQQLQKWQSNKTQCKYATRKAKLIAEHDIKNFKEEEKYG